MTVGKMIEIFKKNNVSNEAVIKTDNNVDIEASSIVSICYNKEKKVVVLQTKFKGFDDLNELYGWKRLK